MSGEVFHGPLLTTHTGFELAVIVERNKDASKRKYPHVRVVRSIDAVLNDPSIELVVVNTPNGTHYDYTRLSLEAGKHVVVEKPFVATHQEGLQLIRLGKGHDKMISVFQNRRYDSDFLTVKSILETGELGRLVEFESHYDRYRPSIDTHSWKDAGGAGSGIVFNLGSHMIDQALVLFGMPDSVQATIKIQRMGGVSDDYYHIHLDYPHHRAILKASYLVKELGPRYLLLGEKGTFIKYGIDPQEEDLKKGLTPGGPKWGVEEPASSGRISAVQEGKDSTSIRESIPGNYLTYYDGIHNHLRNGASLPVTAEQALQTIKIIELAYRSSKEENRSIKIA